MSRAQSTAAPFSQEGEHEANPQALDAIVRASALFPMFASRDIVDARGIKLWAAGRAVSAELQQRLLERKLKKPLEACLAVESGVTLFTLHKELQAFLDSDDALAKGLQPSAPVLLEQLQHVSLHPVAQLLLTTAMATRPEFMRHAVMAMALAGAIMAHRRASSADIRLALLGGLLHDIGEVYVEPVFLERTGPLDVTGHKHLVVHPRMAQLLLASTTDYPPALTRAVGEHHERMDGSGYPARLVGTEISPLGQVLAIVDETLDALTSTPSAPLARASFSLRAVPGEFNTRWAGLVIDLARDAQEVAALGGKIPLSDTDGPMRIIANRLMQATELDRVLREQGRTRAALDIVQTAIQRLGRLRVAWNALGAWGLKLRDATSEESAEIDLLWHVLNKRLCTMQRESLLLAEHLPAAERRSIAVLWTDLPLSDDATPGG